MARSSIGIVDIGGGGIRGVRYAFDGRTLVEETLYEKIITTVPRKDNLTTRQIQGISGAVLEAVKQFEKAEAVFVLGTAGLRAAGNIQTLCNVAQKNKISIELVDEKDEARCDGRAVGHYLSMIGRDVGEIVVYYGKEGGGSYESGILRNGEIIRPSSIPVGIVSIARSINARPTPRMSHVISSLNEIEASTTSTLDEKIPDLVVFCGRTMKRVARMAAAVRKEEVDEQHLHVDSKTIETLIDVLEIGDSTRLRSKFGVNPENRVKMLAGALSMQTILRASAHATALVSPISFREGFALYQLDGTPWGEGRLREYLRLSRR